VTFRLGHLSETKLVHVDVGLVMVVRRAIELTEQDFGVYEGLRDIERQRKLFAAGASRTLDSYHLADGFGIAHAVDLVPYIDGKLQWQDVPCVRVARAMHQASGELDVEVTWGGVFDRTLRALDPANLETEIEAYVARWRKAHPRPLQHKGYWGPLVDRPHFQGIRESLALAA